MLLEVDGRHVSSRCASVRLRGWLMAIGTLQLHRTLRALQVGLQMDLVIQFDGAGVRRMPRSNCCEFRMTAADRVNPGNDTHFSIDCGKVCVALGTVLIAGGG